MVRTAWLYGAHGPCFPTTIVRVLGERGAIDVVDDQLGQPTWTADLADLIHRLVVAGAPAGTYHGTSSGTDVVARVRRCRGGSRRAGRDGGRADDERRVRPPRARGRPTRSWATTRCAPSGVEPIGDWAQRWDEAAPIVLAPTSSPSGITRR